MSSATPGLASKFAPIVPTGMRSSRTSQAVGERAARDLTLQRLERRGRLQLPREGRHARFVQAKPIERSLVELPASGVDVALIRGEHVRCPLLEQLGRPPERRSHRCIVQRRQRRRRRDRLALDEFAHHALLCTLQTARRGRERVPLRIKRGRGIRPDDASATCLSARCQPAEQHARIDVERRHEGENQCPPSTYVAATAVTSSASTQSARATSAGARSSLSTTSTSSAPA